MTFGENVAALDWVHALILGMDPSRLPLVRHAFDSVRHPIAEFGPDEIRVHLDGRDASPSELLATVGRRVKLASGWRGHCEAG